MPIWKIVLLASALIFAAFSIFLWIFNVIRAKKLRATNFLDNNQEKIAKAKFPFKVEKFIDILGGINNIVVTSVISNRIKIKLVDIKKVDIFDLKKIKNQGILEQSDGLTIVLDKNAAELSALINHLLSLKAFNKQN